MKQRAYMSILVVGIACLCNIFISCSDWNNIAYAQGQIDFPMRAVSVSVLQEKLEACQSTSSCPQELLQFAGLTTVIGYIRDEGNHDLILFGSFEPDLPPLYVEDFVVALRNAWLKYAEVKDNTYYYSDPGCSIDPDPEVMRQLDTISQKIFATSSPEAVEKEIERWHQVCQQPQQVRVLGIPFHTRFAKIMVDADYYMKRLVDGSVSLDVEGFTSLIDMTLNRVKQDILENKHISVALSSMNRFWFYPGENRYTYDNGTVQINTCPVILLTEAQYLTKSNNISGTGKADPFAQKFAEDFSTHYTEIAKKKPLFSELEGLFRFVALAKIVKAKGVEGTINLDYLLERFPVSQVRLASTLPGLPNVKHTQIQQDIQGSTQISQFWMPSCGGVGIDINVDPEDFVRDQTGELAKLRASTLASRPSQDAVSWEITDTGIAPPGREQPPVTEPSSPSEPGSIAQPPSDLPAGRTITIGRHTPRYYQIASGESDEVREADHIPNAVEIFADQLEALSDDQDSLNVVMDGFEYEEAVGFLKSSELAAETKRLEHPQRKGFQRFTDQIRWFVKGLVVPYHYDLSRVKIGQAVIEEVQDGPHKGKFSAKIPVEIPSVERKSLVLTIIAYFRQKIAALVANMIRQVVSNVFKRSVTEKMGIDELAKELRRELRQAPEVIDVDIQYTDEYVDMFLLKKENEHDRDYREDYQTVRLFISISNSSNQE